MSKVVGIDRGHVTVEGQPDPNVVKMCEDMLMEAKSGRLHAVAYVTDTAQGVEWGLRGSAMGFDMIGGLEMAKRCICSLMDKD